MNIQGSIPVGLTGLILLSKGLFSNEYSPSVQKHEFAFFGKVMSLFFNMLSRFVTAFLLKSKNL